MTETLPVALTCLTDAQKAALINLIRRAAKTEILPRFGQMSGVQIATKTGRHDLVTEADTAAEQMISRGLQRLFPHALVVGEEAISRNPELRDEIAGAELAFVIDPVDGTWNYAHRLAIFGVIVAVTRFGTPVLGILYDPIADDWIIAAEDTPAERVTAVSRGRHLSVSTVRAPEEMSGYVHLHMMPLEKRRQLAPVLAEFARCGVLRSSCHEYRMLAQGAAEFCLSAATPHPWDHLAGVLICQRAGGVAAMLDGRPYDASITKGYILTATDQKSWDMLRDRFACLLVD